MSLTQLSALNTLHHEGPMTPGALAAAERVQPPSMTRVLASLADLGMIQRQPHPTDGRQSIVSLAPLGEEVISAELAARREWLSEQLDDLDPDELAALRGVVGIINKIVNSTDTPMPIQHPAPVMITPEADASGLIGTSSVSVAAAP